MTMPRFRNNQYYTIFPPDDTCCWFHYYNLGHINPPPSSNAFMRAGTIDKIHFSKCARTDSKKR